MTTTTGIGPAVQRVTESTRHFPPSHGACPQRAVDPDDGASTQARIAKVRIQFNPGLTARMWRSVNT
jgi:hypothetical protein